MPATSQTRGKRAEEGYMSTFRSQQGRTVIRMDILPPDRAVRTASPIRGRGDVVDAQFVTVRDSSARRSVKTRSHNDNRSRPAANAKAPLTERMLAAAERKLMGLSADFFSAVVAVVFIAVFALMGGFSFLFGSSEAASARPLDIPHVTMTPQDANGMRVL